MSIAIVNVGRLNGETILVEFSDQNFATFTVAELMSARQSRVKLVLSDPAQIISADLIN